MRIVFLPELLEELENLVDILHKKGYFGFRHTSHNYVADLIDDILSNLPKLPHKPSPQYFEKYGKNMFYATFRKNRQTTWYVFFAKYNQNGDIIYLIQYIANNHTVAQFLEI